MTVNNGVAWRNQLEQIVTTQADEEVQIGSRATANSCNGACRFWSIHRIPLDPPPETGNTEQDALNLQRWAQCIEEWKCTKCGLKWGSVKTGACLACAANFCETCWHAHWYVMHHEDYFRNHGTILFNDDICPGTDQDLDVVPEDQIEVPVVDQTIVPETGEGDQFQMQVSDETLPETGLGDEVEGDMEYLRNATPPGTTWVFGENGSILDITPMELAPPPDEDTLGEATDQANPQE